MIDDNLELKTKQPSPSPLLLSVRVFYVSTRNEVTVSLSFHFSLTYSNPILGPITFSVIDVLLS